MDDKPFARGVLRRCCLVGIVTVLCTGSAVSVSIAGPPGDLLSSPNRDDVQILRTQFQESEGKNQSRRPSPSGTSSAKAKRAALADLPLNKLKPADRRRAKAIIDSAGMFRRLPTIVFASNPDAYEYFVYHPDVVVSIWRAMGVSKLQMWQTDQFEYEGDAHDGTIGTLDVVYQSPNRNLIICDGEFKSPLIPKPIKASSVILLRSGYFKEPDGTIYVTHSADLFVFFPSQTIDSIAKILTPLSGRIADRTFSEVSLFLKMMSMTMSQRPGWVEKLTEKMDGIPKMRRQQLLKLTAQVYSDELKRQGKFPLEISQRTRPTPKRASARLNKPGANRRIRR